MKIAFIGCVALSRAVLGRIIGLPGVEIVGVASRRASAVNADFAPLDGLAEKAAAPIFYTDDKPQAELAAWLRERRPDVIYCIGWSSLLGRDVLDVAPLGVLGFHPSALPDNRGRHPLIWALALGLDQTASTFFMMDEGADTGDIVDQVPVGITPDDDAASLYDKVTEVALTQIDRITEALRRGQLQRRPQPTGSGNAWRKRGKADGQIDWRMSARSIHNLVRALTRPYVGAHCLHRGQEIKIWRTRPLDGAAKSLEPGKVLGCEDGSLVVKCGEGSIQVMQHEFALLPETGSYL